MLRVSFCRRWQSLLFVCQAGAYVLMAMNRIRQMHAQPAPISVAQMSNNPYIVKMLRKAIDGGAFKIYGHWVKRSENQNRAALFESDIKRDIKLSTSRWCFTSCLSSGPGSLPTLPTHNHLPAQLMFSLLAFALFLSCIGATIAALYPKRCICIICGQEFHLGYAVLTVCVQNSEEINKCIKLNLSLFSRAVSLFYKVYC